MPKGVLRTLSKIYDVLVFAEFDHQIGPQNFQDVSSVLLEDLLTEHFEGAWDAKTLTQSPIRPIKIDKILFYFNYNVSLLRVF